jgi:hypothetical protein
VNLAGLSILFGLLALAVAVWPWGVAILAGLAWLFLRS